MKKKVEEFMRGEMRNELNVESIQAKELLQQIVCIPQEAEYTNFV